MLPLGRNGNSVMDCLVSAIYSRISLEEQGIVKLKTKPNDDTRNYNRRLNAPGAQERTFASSLLQAIDTWDVEYAVHFHLDSGLNCIIYS